MIMKTSTATTIDQEYDRIMRQKAKVKINHLTKSARVIRHMVLQDQLETAVRFAADSNKMALLMEA